MNREQIEWACQNCDADNSVCGCKQEPIAMIDYRYPGAIVYFEEESCLVDKTKLYTHPKSHHKKLMGDEPSDFKEPCVLCVHCTCIDLGRMCKECRACSCSSKVTDAVLSRAVARIMYPEYEWSTDGKSTNRVIGFDDDNNSIFFNYKDKECAWEMAVWLADYYGANADEYNHREVLADLGCMLTEPDPKHALATAIKEIGE